METKGAFAKVFQKTLIRTRAKVLQNLGRADKTKDEKFEDHVVNFNKQQIVAARLQKEVKHYVNCIKAMTAASMSLYTVIRECYEPDWVDVHSVEAAIKSLDMLYSNYEAELFDRVCADLHTYVELFNPMKEKISKRRRKLLDYDNAKHSYDSACNAKKPDDIKIAKASEQLHEAERMYNDLNTELLRELPKFYNYRIDFIASNLSRLYSTESTFHSETGKVTDGLHELMQRIPPSEERSDSYTPSNPIDQSGLDLSNLEGSVHHPPIATGKEAYTPEPNDLVTNTATSEPLENSLQTSGDDAVSSPLTNHQLAVDVANQSTHSAAESGASGTSPLVIEQPPQSKGSHSAVKGDDTILLAESIIASEYDVPSNIAVKDTSGAGEAPYQVYEEPGDDQQELVYENVSEVTPAAAEAIDVGHQVLATHNYTAEDEDELSFEAGEVIQVIEFDDPDDQDDGWLMGVSKKTGRKGVFPQNFTRKVTKRVKSDS